MLGVIWRERATETPVRWRRSTTSRAEVRASVTATPLHLREALHGLGHDVGGGPFEADNEARCLGTERHKTAADQVVLRSRGRRVPRADRHEK